jgi:hypothetical protein
VPKLALIHGGGGGPAPVFSTQEEYEALPYLAWEPEPPPLKKKKEAEEIALYKAETDRRRRCWIQSHSEPATSDPVKTAASQKRQDLSREAASAIASGNPFPVGPLTVQFLGGESISFSQDHLANLFIYKRKAYRWTGREQNPVEVRGWLRVHGKMTAREWLDLFREDLSPA